MAHSSSSNIGPIAKFKAAKTYLEDNNIPKMFECLIASLMMEQPENPYKYLDKQLDMIKEIGLEKVDFDTFIQQLHPSKDPVRLENIHDETSLKIKQANEVDPAKMTTEGSYQPDVFQLTEPQED